MGRPKIEAVHCRLPAYRQPLGGFPRCHNARLFSEPRRKNRKDRLDRHTRGAPYIDPDSRLAATPALKGS